MADQPLPDDAARGGARERKQPSLPLHLSSLDREIALQRAERSVVEDPEVRGGEPVVRGTRVPVHLLVELAKQGASREELLEDFPSVSAEALEAALLYARLHRRKDRPKRAPWRS